MKIHTDAAARRAVVISAALMALAASRTSVAAAATASRGHSPSGSCVRASVLAFRDRHAMADRVHLADAVDTALKHRQAPCAALVDYLKQSAA